ncbi:MULTISPECIES: hypothetical protein [Pseudomonadaceae]|uniref:hypothetical protein n=1 Tax=Pseudomonadaceae TaxID=135621 RepID=UPI001112DCAF|nr:MULTISPECIES: hypothetical protein [Pseudomonas]
MTSTVLVRLIVDTDSEKDMPATEVAAAVSRDFYHPEILDELIREVFNSALEKRYVAQISELNKLKPEVGVSIRSDEGIRPSFHLSWETLCLISEAGAELDFDPYVF